MRTHTNLQLEHRLELYETGMLPWDLEMTVEEPMSDDEDEDGVPHCVSDSQSKSENDSDYRWEKSKKCPRLSVQICFTNNRIFPC